jgi:hypothetical protein
MGTPFTIPIGSPFTMTQNQTYAVPPRVLSCHVQGAAAMEQSNDGSTWDAVTLDDDEQFLVGAAFIRSTAVDTIVVLKG